LTSHLNSSKRAAKLALFLLFALPGSTPDYHVDSVNLTGFEFMQDSSSVRKQPLHPIKEKARLFKIPWLLQITLLL